jgi:hypothetical protein
MIRHDSDVRRFKFIRAPAGPAGGDGPSPGRRLQLLIIVTQSDARSAPPVAARRRPGPEVRRRFTQAFNLKHPADRVKLVVCRPAAGGRGSLSRPVSAAEDTQ